MAAKYDVIAGGLQGTQIERKATTGTIKPGHLIELDPSDTENVRLHGTQGGACSPVLVAVEDKLQGNGIDDAYTIENRVMCRIVGAGTICKMRMEDGNNFTHNMKVQSNGAGLLEPATTISSAAQVVQAGSIVGTVLDALDLSSSSGAESTYMTRILIA